MKDLEVLKQDPVHPMTLELHWCTLVENLTFRDVLEEMDMWVAVARDAYPAFLVRKEQIFSYPPPWKELSGSCKMLAKKPAERK